MSNVKNTITAREIAESYGFDYDREFDLDNFDEIDEKEEEKARKINLEIGNEVRKNIEAEMLQGVKDLQSFCERYEIEKTIAKQYANGICLVQLRASFAGVVGHIHMDKSELD